jgi:hypothetical protein
MMSKEDRDSIDRSLAYLTVFEQDLHKSQSQNQYYI